MLLITPPARLDLWSSDRLRLVPTRVPPDPPHLLHDPPPILDWIDTLACPSSGSDGLSVLAILHKMGRQLLATSQFHRLFSTITLGANPHSPSGYMVGSLWFLDQSAQHLPTRYVLVTFVMYSAIHPAKTLWVQVGFFCKVPSQVPSRHI